MGNILLKRESPRDEDDTTSVTAPAHPRRRRWAIEAALGYAAFAYIALIEIERLLGLARLQDDSSPAGFSADVLTRPRLGWPLDLIWSNAEAAAAFGVLDGPDRDLVIRLLYTYLGIDLLLLFAVTGVLAFVLVRLGQSPAIAVFYGVADLFETGLAVFALLLGGLADPVILTILGFLSLAKWIFLAATIGLILLSWWQRDRDGAAAIRQPWIRVLPQFVVVGGFVLLMAVPGPSAMTQLPDVLRASLEGEHGDGGVLSFLAFPPLFLFVAVIVAVRAATSAPKRLPATPTAIVGWLWPLAIGLVAALIVFFGVLFAGHSARLAPWAWLAVPVVVTLIGGTVAYSRRNSEDSSDVEPQVLVFQPAARRWLAIGLASGVLVGESLALVRAALPPALLNVELDGVPYLVWAAIGLVGAVCAAPVIELIADRFGRITRGRPTFWRITQAIVVVLLAVAVVVLTATPNTSAPTLGTPGVIAVAFSAAAVAAAFLTRLSLVTWSSDALRMLRINDGRPSWLMYLLSVWLVSSLLGGPTGYHDANTTARRGAEALTLDQAVDAWLTTHAVAGDECISTTKSGQRVVPLVLVAAPGGGIRAAYWTTAALDSLFSTSVGAPCRGALFAVSGASGGSVGATVRLLTDPAEPALPAIQSMARDHALAANVAAMFFRDFLQSWFPAPDLWDDRAGVHESAWEVDAPVLEGKSASTIGQPWAAASRDGLSSAPGVLLGSSSVNDGCRAITSSWADVVAEGNGCTDRGGGSFTLTAAHDIRADITGEGDESDLPAVTAALLSARFPWVSPTGAIHRGGSPEVLYLADGGIYENTALLGLLQVWDTIEPMVVEHNRRALATRDASADSGNVLVEPWIVYLDNGFEVGAPAADIHRPRELSAPIASMLQEFGQVTAGENALLQAADLRFNGPLPGTKTHLGYGRRVIVLQPTDNDPGLTAPLGWVLAPSTQETLDDELAEALMGSEAILARLHAQDSK